MVFRFSTPLTISIADFFFLGRQLPSPRSWASLVALLLGALGYATTDAAFEVRGYLFCAAWYLVFCLDQVNQHTPIPRPSHGISAVSPLPPCMYR
jgi:solute carrier family 35 protein